METYTLLAQFAQKWVLILFGSVFLAFTIYALWPRNKATFDAAARSPLEEDK